jgi:hypothetical protein
MVITWLCYFFNKISQKVIDEDKLKDLQEFIGDTMVQLEMCFRLEFYDIMEHLNSHGQLDMCTWSTLPARNMDV